MEFFIFGDKINRRNIADFFSQLSEKKKLSGLSIRNMPLTLFQVLKFKIKVRANVVKVPIELS